jgi:hypothetical protein
MRVRTSLDEVTYSGEELRYVRRIAPKLRSHGRVIVRSPALMLFALALLSCSTLQGQLPVQSVFQTRAQNAISGGKLFSVVNLTATAEWTAGSDKESGTAQLQAKADGSTNIQLTLEAVVSFYSC